MRVPVDYQHDAVLSPLSKQWFMLRMLTGLSECMKESALREEARTRILVHLICEAAEFEQQSPHTYTAEQVHASRLRLDATYGEKQVLMARVEAGVRGFDDVTTRRGMVRLCEGMPEGGV